MSEDNPTQDDELTKLREHNATLLDEAKKAKQRAKDAEAEQASLQEQLQTAQTEIQRIKVDAPVESMLQRIAPQGASEALHSMMQSKGLDFTLGEDDQLTVTANGEPATDADGEVIPFTEDGIREWLSPKDQQTVFANFIGAKSVGGMGSDASAGMGDKTSATDKPKPPRFGLA